MTVSEVARQVSLKQATVTDILNRLEYKGLVLREKDTKDRRRVLVRETDAGKKLLKTAPSPLQETFLEKYGDLEDWKQHMILASLQLVSTMMVDDEISAAPILLTKSLIDWYNWLLAYFQATKKTAQYTVNTELLHCS